VRRRIAYYPRRGTPKTPIDKNYRIQAFAALSVGSYTLTIHARKRWADIRLQAPPRLQFYCGRRPFNEESYMPNSTQSSDKSQDQGRNQSSQQQGGRQGQGGQQNQGQRDKSGSQQSGGTQVDKGSRQADDDRSDMKRK
jgi:hypothetical protein